MGAAPELMFWPRCVTLFTGYVYHLSVFSWSCGAKWLQGDLSGFPGCGAISSMLPLSQVWDTIVTSNWLARTPWPYWNAIMIWTASKILWLFSYILWNNCIPIPAFGYYHRALPIWSQPPQWLCCPLPTLGFSVPYLPPPHSPFPEFLAKQWWDGLECRSNSAEHITSR
jgi:hypothetical protein